jgi:cell division protein FtsI/penicillin-binding protein 2
LTDEEAQKLREENLSGIYLSPEDVRFYPAGDLASQVIGFVGSDGTETNGRYGIEAFWEKELKGETGSLFQERDNRGRWISVSDRDLKEAKDGSDLVLTIDYTLQYETEKILKETVEKHQADGGTVIIMEPSTGKILALANAPSFNPNEFGKAENMEVFLNPAVSGTYECGSVFKTITAAIGIDSGKIRPETTFTDTGVIHEAGYAIKNSDGKAYGRQTMTEVLEKSLNTGAIFIEQSIGNRMFQEYLKRFGFGERTGIELPGEVPGNVSNLNNLKRDINFFTASFGQGISVTPLQLLNAYATIANGGKLMKPQIVERIVDPSGSEKEIEPEELRRVISEEAARETGRMLRSVVVTGHGKRADVPGYLVGGKTGTAEVAKAGAKGYEEGLTIGSFAGYAPIDNPRFAILVKITNPKGVQWAESTAAPAFGKIMKFALEYYKVESTEPIDVKKLNAASELENSPLIPAVQPDN